MFSGIEPIVVEIDADGRPKFDGPFPLWTVLPKSFVEAASPHCSDVKVDLASGKISFCLYGEHAVYTRRGEDLSGNWLVELQVTHTEQKESHGQA